MTPITRVDADASSTAPLRLYFAPLACSLATRIACYEAGAEIEYVQVDTKTKRIEDGSDYRTVNPMGQVPVLEIGPDLRLSENSAVLQYVADRFPNAALAPTGGFARARLQQWLGFIGTELHKAVFVPLLAPQADPAIRRDADAKAALRLDVLDEHLSANEHLLDRYSIADAYLATVLNWSPYAGIDLSKWPAVRAYQQRITARPAVARAIAEESALWQAEQRRRAA